MRILFTFIGGSGHFYPLVPVAEAAAAAGQPDRLGAELQPPTLDHGFEARMTRSQTAREGDVIPGLEARSMGSKNSSGAHKLSALIRRRFGTQEFRGDSPVALRFLAHTRRNTKLHQTARVRLRGIVGARPRGSMCIAGRRRCPVPSPRRLARSR